KIRVGSNTSIFGVNGARIIHGMLTISAGIENIVIRNVTFEDSLDQFPIWDPSDTYKLDTSVTGCAAIYASPLGGPQMCPGGRWNSNYDNINIVGGHHIWIDHCTFSDGDRPDSSSPSVFGAPHDGKDYWVQHHDGAVDITNTSDFVT